MVNFKPPSFIIQSIFSRLVPSTEPVKTSNIFLLKGKCPICGDYKKRMFCKEYPNYFLVYCHNCGVSTNFTSFLREYYPSELPLLNEYVLDALKSGEVFSKKKYRGKKKEVKVDKREENDMKLDFYAQSKSFLLTEKQKHSVKERCRKESVTYCKNRKIPEELWKEFRFFFSGPLKGYIGIPMWSDNKEYLLHIQGRLLYPNEKVDKQQKYLFLKDKDAGIVDIPKPVYGLWRANPDKTVYINEGTLDAPAFGLQGIATCGARISDGFIGKLRKKFKKRIWAVDNYWIDKDGCELTEKLLLKGESCFVIPPKMYSKDGNSLLEELGVDVIPPDFINNNIYTGKLGLVKLKLLLKSK